MRFIVPFVVGAVISELAFRVWPTNPLMRFSDRLIDCVEKWGTALAPYIGGADIFRR